MNTNFDRASRYSAAGIATASILAVVLAMAVSTIPVPAHAEYRCAVPGQLTNAEKRACKLAQQDSPAGLIHFVNRTKSIYGLYSDDYVTRADVERWELVKREAAPDMPSLAKFKSDTRASSRAD